MYLNLQEAEQDYNATIKTEEKYIKTFFGKTALQLTTYVIDKETGQKWQVDQRKVTLPASIPKYITKHNLWKHTDLQLKELERLLSNMPPDQTQISVINNWKSQIAKQD